MEILKTRNLKKRFKKKEVLKDISLELDKGRIYGFVGSNGSGKTTFMRIIAGLSFEDQGEYELFGVSSSNKDELVIVRKRIGCLIEKPALYEELTAADNIMIYERLRGTKEENLLELVGLGDAAKTKVKDFSLGMKQRLGIAIALVGKPELLILDEPINGLDPLGVREITKVLKDIVEKYKTTILISSHILSELMGLVTDLIFINDGIIVEQIEKKELCEKSEDIEEYFFKLIEK